MFDFSKLGDLSKMASQAKQMQSKQEDFQRQQMDIFKKISKQLEEIIVLLRNKSN